MKIILDKLSQRQNNNLKDSLKSYENKNVISSEKPAVLYLELTRNCVARCVFCRPLNFVNSPSNNMLKNIFDILKRDYLPFAAMVSLNGWGESLILPDFSSYVEAIAEHGPKMRITTTLGCGNKKALQSLIDYDVYIAVSFDAADRRIYEGIRRKARYKTVIKNLTFITKRILDKHGTLNDRIRLEIHPLQGKNLDYVSGIIDFAEKYKIPEILLGPLGSSSQDQNLLAYHKDKTREVLSLCVNRSKENGIVFRLMESPFSELCFQDRAFERCFHPWAHAFINFRGDFIYCDHLVWPGYAEHIIGNISEKELKSLWNSRKMQLIREAHIKREKGLIKPCEACYARGRYAECEQDLDQQFSRWELTQEHIEDMLLGRHISG